MDLVVTCPKWFWKEWIAEGDAVGDPPTGTEWAWFMGGARPPIQRGERLYVVAHGRLRGYAPVTVVMRSVCPEGEFTVSESLQDKLGERGKWAICRRAGAVAVTIDQEIRGFQGYRKVWWRREDEVPFPDWQTANVS